MSLGSRTELSVESGVKDTWRPGTTTDIRRLRAAVYRHVRDFFHERRVMEVETPMISSAANSDPQIESLAVSGHDNPGTSHRFLRTSAEFAMKRLLAAGSGPIYELGRVFRSGEVGHWHEPEFTMLEWYRPGFIMTDLIDETCELLSDLFWRFAARKPEIRKHGYVSLFIERTGLSPISATVAELSSRCESEGLHTDGLTRDALIDGLMALVVQPSLEDACLHIISDYPADQAALARLCDDNPELASRFEVFYGSVELANGYHELIDAEELEQRFDDEIQKRRANQQVTNPVDQNLIDATFIGMEDCSGIALGMDRLLMCLSAVSDIRQVINFVQENA